MLCFNLNLTKPRIEQLKLKIPGLSTITRISQAILGFVLELIIIIIINYIIILGFVIVKFRIDQLKPGIPGVTPFLGFVLLTT